MVLLLAYAMIGQSQNIFVPDDNFEQALIDLGYDSGVLDDSIPSTNVNSLSLDVSNKNIADLTGIEAFVSLTVLECHTNQITNLNLSQNVSLTDLSCRNNQLSSLDVSQNTALSQLNCSYNQLSSLNITQNTALLSLNCYDNQFTSLDVSQNTALTVLGCADNQLTNLDVSQNTLLMYFYCYNNQLTSLDVSQNTALNVLNCSNNELSCLNAKNGNNNNQSFIADNNSNLTCITVDNVTWSVTNWTNIDSQTSFSIDCMDFCSSSLSASIDEVELINNHFFAYPNPTNGQLTIDLNEFSTNINVILCNSLGQIVYYKAFENSDQISFEIDIPKGVYFLRLDIDSREGKTIKIIKQ